MFIHRHFLLACALVVCSTALFALAATGQEKGARETSPTSTAPIKLEPCEVDGARAGVKEKVRCGTYEVFENRARKSGRKIALKIVVFPATGQDREADPFFYIPGGPGSSATEDAPYVAQEFARIRERRDLVFLDQRGTGGSNPLNCVLFNSSSLQNYLGAYFPLEEVRKCREQLEPKADLKLYTTPIAMDDLDEVRAALGYERINIFGGSYGTRAAQVYLKRHPKHVRAIVLHGVSPTGQFMPRDFPQHTESALNGVLDECAADEACRAAFPNLRAEAKAVLERLLRGAVEVAVKHPQSGVSTRVELSRDLAGEAIRYMLYQSGAASRIPLFIHLAAEGNFTPLAEAAIFYRQQIVATGSNGMYLSVTCAEDLPWIKPGEGERNAAHTFLGDYRLHQQRAACALWPRAEIPRDYAEPTRSDVPALIFTGQWDPVTPPVYGDMAARHLTNSLHLVIPHGGHGFNGLDGLDCVQNLIIDFINRGATKGLDTSCIGRIRRKGFLLKLPEPKKPS
ncbi:MAG TPA: alpha/beta fold hydrolase [Pyrinomonadaceae bacterium]|jgi:pimeloyl-ACP methyl ester carboxylesterase|nr:alpha/beta fold hydrolase [Pyrinomonadaceae bacterium]